MNKLGDIGKGNVFMAGEACQKKRYPIITVIPKVPSQIYLFGQFILCSSLFYILVQTYRREFHA
jgi:hypothetical protein